MEHNHTFKAWTSITYPDCPKCRLNSNAESLLLAAEDMLRACSGEDCPDEYDALKAIRDTIRGREEEQK